MYKDFRHYCRQAHPDSGELWTWGGPGGVRIVNLITQEAAYDHGSRPGKATTKSVNKCLAALREEIETEGFSSVALPRLATGVGGLDWSEVEPLVQRHLADQPFEVFVYETYVPSQQAAEVV
ncbi:MAG: macro domain-containing protein [Planctomycetota bacterium]